MRANIIINRFITADEPKQNPIRIIDRIRRIALQFSAKFVSSQSRIKRVMSEPLILLLSQLLNLIRKLAVGLGEGGRNVNPCDRTNHLLTKLGKRPHHSRLAVLEFFFTLPYLDQSILNLCQMFLQSLILMPRNHHQLNPMRELLWNRQRMLHNFLRPAESIPRT